MFCEKTVKHNSAFIYIAHCGDGDVRWLYRPAAERFNPLRYEIGIRLDPRSGPALWLNRNRKWHRRLINFRWRIMLKLRVLPCYSFRVIPWWNDVVKRDPRERMCCDGHMCGCRGVCLADWWEFLIERKDRGDG